MLFSKKLLDTDQAKALTSREIAKIISGIMGSLASWCDLDEIFDAIDFIHQHRKQLKSQLELIKSVAEDVNAKR